MVIVVLLVPVPRALCTLPIVHVGRARVEPLKPRLRFLPRLRLPKRTPSSVCKRYEAATLAAVVREGGGGTGEARPALWASDSSTPAGARVRRTGGGSGQVQRPRHACIAPLACALSRASCGALGHATWARAAGGWRQRVRAHGLRAQAHGPFAVESLCATAPYHPEEKSTQWPIKNGVRTHKGRNARAYTCSLCVCSSDSPGWLGGLNSRSQSGR